jgi:hypothetical protein
MRFMDGPGLENLIAEFFSSPQKWSKKILAPLLHESTRVRFYSDL